jgi:hypothetical protein
MAFEVAQIVLAEPVHDDSTVDGPAMTDRSGTVTLCT